MKALSDWLRSTALAIPKSMMVGIGFPSVTRTRMLLGLRSRWITPFWCACWTPLANGDEELEPAANFEVVAVAVVGERLARDELHDEVRKPVLGGAGVERLRDVWVVHDGERLALALEAGQHLAVVHAEADDLERHHAVERLELLGLIDETHAALAEDAQDAIGADVQRVHTGPRSRGGSWHAPRMASCVGGHQGQSEAEAEFGKPRREGLPFPSYGILR